MVKNFYLHYALCDFDSILLHYTKLFIRQSVDRKKIFDVTFENPHCKILRTPQSVLLHLLATRTDQSFLKDEVSQF